MSNEKVYTIYDKVAAEGGPLFNARNDDVACRYVIDMLLRQYKGQLVEDDYVLYHVAEYDSEVPVVQSIPPRIVDYKPAFEKAVGKKFTSIDLQRKMFDNAQTYEEVKK